ncbi:MAG: ABC transporter substrate-binding protein [Promethearchaeota archaeon]
MSDHGEIQQNFYSKLKNKLTKNTSITKINSSDITKEIISQHNLIISIGYKSAKVMAKHKTKKNVIYTLIPDNGSLRISIPCKKTTCYKIYINQPVSRYVQLFKNLFPKGKTLAFATTKENSIKLQQLKTESKNNNLIYKEIRIQKNKNISRTFINKLNNNDVLLALANPDIYNANNAKSIILSTYHASVPIIAYSKSFAKAGALISLYSSIDNIAEKTANIVNAIIADGSLKQKEYYPDDFTIEINSAVARSLNINIDSENMLKRKIK